MVLPELVPDSWIYQLTSTQSHAEEPRVLDWLSIQFRLNCLSSGGGNEPVDENEVGTAQFGLIAGAGTGNKGTGAITLVDRTLCQANKLCIWSGSYYSPSNAGTADMTGWSGVFGPSEKVPYVIVRDNVCLIYDVGSTANWGHDTLINVRLECATITLDQSTLNQLLRTQTV